MRLQLIISASMFLQQSTISQAQSIAIRGLEANQSESEQFRLFLEALQYDYRQAPDNYGPVRVNVSLEILNIFSVTEITMSYDIELFFREHWVDFRLQYNQSVLFGKHEISLHEDYLDFLWFPDTIIPNAVRSENPDKHSVTHRLLLRLNTFGAVLFSRRVSATVTCGMDLSFFPFDTQLCKFAVESYGHTSNQISYDWGPGDLTPLIIHPIKLPDFTLKEAFVTRDLIVYATGNYSRLYGCFIFKRSAGFCILQLVIPSVVVVFIAWMALWLKHDTTLSDIISLVLTLILLLYSYNSVMPRVSYVKAMDIFLGVCFLTVFLALMKLAFMKWMLHFSDESPPTQIYSTKDDRKMKIHFSMKTIDRVQMSSQIAFFVLFVAFCVYYFLFYTSLNHAVTDPDCAKEKVEWVADVTLVNQ